MLKIKGIYTDKNVDNVIFIPIEKYSNDSAYGIDIILNNKEFTNNSVKNFIENLKNEDFENWNDNFIFWKETFNNLENSNSGYLGQISEENREKLLKQLQYSFVYKQEESKRKYKWIS